MLTAGTHIVTIRDAMAVTFNITVVITEPSAPLDLAITQVNLLCPGGNTGSAAVTATGGTEPIVFHGTQHLFRQDRKLQVWLPVLIQLR